MVCPITNKLCLFLIHEELYNLHANESSRIEIVQNSDIDLINSLQILNSHRHIFFSEKNNFEDIRRSYKIALQFKREFPETRRKRPYDDIKDRIYPIHFSFLNAKSGIDMSQFENSSIGIKIPCRNKYLYEESLRRAESIITGFYEEFRLFFEKEDL